MKIVIGSESAKPLQVNRLGYGTMQLPGPGVWGEPADRPLAIRILKTAIAKGVNFLDTADFYGKDVTNRLIREALFPYPNDLVICTKVGGARREDKSWYAYATPQNLRDSVNKNLQTLQLEQLPLVHLRVIYPYAVPFDESLDAMFELQREGKILHLGLSNVSPEELELGLKKGTIASVENAYGYFQRQTFSGHGGLTRGGEEVLDLCEKNGIPLVPFFSLQTSFHKDSSKMEEMALKYHATQIQINLAWLLAKSSIMLPIPGTSRLEHLEENLGSSAINLTKEDMDFLN